jgi:hypothetical protein
MKANMIRNTDKNTASYRKSETINNISETRNNKIDDGIKVEIEGKKESSNTKCKFVVDDTCYSDSKCCKHDVYVNGVKGLLRGDTIYMYLLKKNMEIPEHFMVYQNNYNINNSAGAESSM